METYESNDLGETPVNTQSQEDSVPVSPQPEPADYGQETYRNQGAGRKESPFADSPYVMNYSSGNADVPPVQPKVPKAKKKSGGKAWKAVTATVLAVVLVAGGCGITAACVNNYWEVRMEQITNAMNQKLNALQEQVDAAGNSGVSVSGSPVTNPEGGLTASQVYAQNVDTVVAISNSMLSTNIYGQTTQTASSGSGFILTENGYVVTNYHVVEGASTLTVITSDRTEYAAELVGYDESNDVAVLKIDATGLPYVTLGSSDELIVGDQVVAIGNPLGELTSTLTAGYVSAINRDVTTESSIINMIQTDAAINPGNSGGPLFNMKGEVIGITTAKYSGTTSSGASIEGIGFAIPIDDVVSLIDDLMNYGYVTGAYLGVMVSNMDESSAQMYGLPIGAYVQSVTDGYCAQAAGVQAKDIIIALGDTTVESITDLTRALRKFKAGDTTTITVYRGGRELTLTVTLDEKPHETTATDGDSSLPSEGSYEDWYNYFFGQPHDDSQTIVPSMPNPGNDNG